MTYEWQVSPLFKIPVIFPFRQGNWSIYFEEGATKLYDFDAHKVHILLGDYRTAVVVLLNSLQNPESLDPIQDLVQFFKAHGRGVKDVYSFDQSQDYRFKHKTRVQP